MASWLNYMPMIIGVIWQGCENYMAMEIQNISDMIFDAFFCESPISLKNNSVEGYMPPLEQTYYKVN